MHRYRLLSILSLLGLTACFNQAHQASNTSGYVSRPDDRWLSSTISTCFEQDGYDLEKRTVSNIVTSEYKKAGLDFVGWEKCTADGADLRIQFENNESGSRVLDFGKRLQGVQKGVVLGLAHECLTEYSGSHCQENVALHEFGHAVGLHHEMNRRDNVDCGDEQTMELGETDAIQIGDFDGLSIMNYCRDFTANAKNEFLGLSAGDIATIRARYTKPTADLATPIPSGIKSKNEFKGKVEGYRVSDYRYKIGLQSEVDCKDPAGYSEAAKVEKEIAADALDGLPKNRTLRLCLLGADEKGVWQDYDRYSSIDFVQLNEKAAKDPVQSIQLVSHDANYLRVDVKLSEPLPQGYLSCEVKYEGEAYATAPCDHKAIMAKDEMSLSALVPRKYLKKNGLAYLSHIMIISNTHETIWYGANDAQSPLKKGFENGSLDSAQYRIVDGLKDDGRVPVIQDIKMLPAQSPESPKYYFEMTVNEGIPSSVSLDYALLGTDKVFSAYSEDFFQVGPKTWHFAISRNRFIYNGSYRLQHAQVYEAYSHNYEVKIAPDATIVDQTQSPVPTLAMDRGFAIDTEPFKMLDVSTKVEDDIYQRASLLVTFDYKIPVDYVHAVFENTLLGTHSDLWLDESWFAEKKPLHELSASIGFDTLNGTYRLKSLDITDVGQNKVHIDIKADDLLIPGTQFPIPTFEITKGKDFAGPSLLSLALDKTRYKKGETLSLIAKTKAGKGMKQVFVDFLGKAPGSQEISAEFETAGDETTSMNVVLDERFPPGEYIVQSFHAMGVGSEDISFWAIDPDVDTYWYSPLKVIRFTVE